MASHQAKKTFYLFLASLMGMLLFILLQRSLFLIAFLWGADVLGVEFQAVDYVSFVAALFIGWWYGLWLGLSWYESIYERGTMHGFLKGLAMLFRNGGNGSDRFQKFSPQQQWELDDLINEESGEGSPTEDASLKSTLEVFESNTVFMSGGHPVHANDLHDDKGASVKVSRSRKAPTARRPAVKKK